MVRSESSSPLVPCSRPAPDGLRLGARRDAPGSATDSRASPAPDMKERIIQYALLMRVHQPIGTLLLWLWPTLWALWIAGAGRPDAVVILVFVAGVFVMRSAGCIVNDFADRWIDPYVRRTMNRPVIRGGVARRSTGSCR